MFWSKLRRNREDVQETSWEKQMDKVYYNRRKPNCGVIVCISIVATLFFVVGLFQTFLAIYYVRESSKRPILVMGPMFAGVGVILYIALIEMCLLRFHRRKRVSSIQKTPVSDALAEEDKPAYAARPRSMMIPQLQTHQLPAFLTLTKDDLMKMGPEQKEQLLGGPLLMSPVTDTSCTAVPLTFKGQLPSPCIPPVATYNPPPEAIVEESESKEEENKTEDTSTDSELPEKIVEGNTETAVEVLNTGCGFTEVSEDDNDTSDDEPSASTVSKATMTEQLLTPYKVSNKHDSKIPEEIFQMLGKVEEAYKNSSETPLNPKALE